MAGGGLLSRERREERPGGSSTPGRGTHWAKSLGPIRPYECTASHLALHFQSALQMHLEFFRRGQTGLENVWVTLDVGVELETCGEEHDPQDRVPDWLEAAHPPPARPG